MKKLTNILLIIFLLSSNMVNANGFDTSMHSQGKMNVVIGVIVIIFAGIILYLFSIDRKLKKIEKEMKD